MQAFCQITLTSDHLLQMQLKTNLKPLSQRHLVNMVLHMKVKPFSK